MGLVDKTVNKTKKTEVRDVDNLTIKEFEFLFNVIKNSTFKGAELEQLYKLTLKLQKQYLALKENLQ